MTTQVQQGFVESIALKRTKKIDVKGSIFNYCKIDKKLYFGFRREVKKCDFQEKIAFSKGHTKQVILRVHTLEQTMINKIQAAINRVEIRDFFDIEFMVKNGVPITATAAQRNAMTKTISGFKESDFSVKLGAVLDTETRRYYTKNHFSYLSDKINQLK